jgi:uncharacterized protein
LKKFGGIIFLCLAGFTALATTSYFYRTPFDLRSLAGPTENLYQAKSLVTGQRDETRIPGFERAIVDVLKKRSGNPLITAEEVAKNIEGKIQDYVKSYTERDRMEGIPIHDEQGTRDRPFELTVTFHRYKIDELLKKMGSMAWTQPRPRTLVLLTITTDAGSHILTEDDEDRDIDQRESFLAAAWQAGIPLVLPSMASLNEAGLTPVTLGNIEATKIKELNSANDADVAIIGRIAWNSGMKGWLAEWKFATNGTIHEWKIDGVNFDAAFRNGMWGEVQILSGHGEPHDGST